MVRLVVLIAQATIIALVVYNAVTALWGWPEAKPSPLGRRDHRFRVVIPAHDEARVIANLIDDVARQDYDPDLVSTWVVADR
jgi:cellulose synthase/poly-beta-1,6-N-acetylglucosamine synthase-like glycosyltransferase